MARFVLAAAALLALCPAHAATIGEVFKRVKDSVVVIHTSERQAPESAGVQPTLAQNLGSGVLVGERKVLTAAHVVQVAEEILVEFPGNETLAARVVASEPMADVAVLELERTPTNPSIAPLGDSDAAEVGDEVIVVGAPLGITHTLTVGHISARRMLNNLFGGFGKAEFLQTDAAINVGNSGGPMFNLKGEVIGIVSHMVSQTGGFQGLGFAVSSNMTRALLEGKRRRWSGMDAFMLDGELARVFELPQARGVLVQRVAKGSPAERMGFLPGSTKAVIGDETLSVGGDVILEVAGINIADPDAPKKIQERLDGIAPGEKLAVLVLRGGKRVELSGTPFPR